jgi:hypothetical protein
MVAPGLRPESGSHRNKPWKGEREFAANKNPSPLPGFFLVPPPDRGLATSATISTALRASSPQ